MASAANFLVEDGIIAWFDGPEWDDVAAEEFRKAADTVKEYAQSNAPWADRTGDARSGLDTQVAEEGGLVELSLFHTVEYGLWLEVIQNGNFAIIMPTLETMAPKVMNDAAVAVGNARKGKDY